MSLLQLQPKKKKIPSTGVSTGTTTATAPSTSNKTKVIKLNSKYDVVKDNMNFITRAQDYYQIFVDRCFAQGKRPYMEDFDLIVRDPSTGIILFIVCDGHGVKTLAKQLIKLLANRLFVVLEEAQMYELRLRETMDVNDSKFKVLLHKHWLTVERTIKETFLDIDDYLYRFFDERNDVGGSTAVVFAFLPWIHRMMTMGVGDSHLLISDKTGLRSQFNTFASKPNHPSEKKRIEAAGGWVTTGKTPRVNGILALSRAMGDYGLKIDKKTGKYHPHNGPVSAMPTVEVWTYNDNLKWICLMSDGITDVMDDPTILTFIEDMNGKMVRPAQALVQEAYNRGSSDNMTALVLFLVPSGRGGAGGNSGSVGDGNVSNVSGNDVNTVNDVGGKMDG